jgi:hypothetical protein
MLGEVLGDKRGAAHFAGAKLGGDSLGAPSPSPVGDALGIELRDGRSSWR